MSTRLDRPATPDGLFLWVMHRFAEEFADHALLKGGMALRLFDSPRSTTDIDYVFVPYSSNKDIRPQVTAILEELEDAKVEVELHSKMLRAEISVDDCSVQLEINVSLECDGIPMSTGGFARQLGQPAQVVRMMSPAWAFAHKLAAWNERRLLRDLYDCYFFHARLATTPELGILRARLAKVQSRLPAIKKRESMTPGELAADLRTAAESLTQQDVEEELGGLLPSEELAGLALRIRASTVKTAEWLEANGE